MKKRDGARHNLGSKSKSRKRKLRKQLALNSVQSRIIMKLYHA